MSKQPKRKHTKRSFLFSLGFLLGSLLPYPVFSELTLIGTMSGAPFDSATVHAFSHPANVGDVNNDGYSDWAIGDPRGDYVYLYFGGATLDTIPDVRFDPGNLSGGYGYSLCGGDLNGDGVNDLIIGAYYSSAGIQYAAGRVFVYYGGSPIDTIVDVMIDGQVLRGFFGKTVVSGGDVNGDGWDDLLVLAEIQYESRGRVYLYHGGPVFDAVADGQIEGEIEDMFHGALDFVGDINGDGCDEFLIGASQWGTNLPGKAYLVYGGTQFSLDSSITIEGDSLYPGNSFGRRIAGLGDVNGDLVPDFAVAATDYCFIYSGLTLNSIWYKKSWSSCSSIASADINHDGFNDVLFGFHYYPNTYAGKVTLYLGNTLVDTVSDAELYGDYPQQNFGFRLASGDFNHDGYPETLISTNYYEHRNKIYLYTAGPMSATDPNGSSTFPQNFRLYPNYPNPFNSTTLVSYTIPYSGLVNLTIYDIRGRIIRLFEPEIQAAGKHKLTWDGTDTHGVAIASGVYFCRLQYGSKHQRFDRLIKLTILK